jgi:peptidoglycan hydrolase-like protein with peptidoglycan-binding domain
LDDEGADVAQFQNLIATLGFYGGEVNGRFDSDTADAAREWQESLGVESTGDVEMGDIVFIAPLPARVVLSDEVVAGSRLSDGEVVMSTLSPHPEFTISLSHEQADLVPLSAEVLVSYPEGVWNARIDRAVETDLGQLDLVLSESAGGSICGGACFDWVDLRTTTSFRAEVVLIPETTGPLVPIAAITTDAVNNPSVTLTDGTLVPVRIIASANGMAVVEGIEPGTEIRLLVDE